MTEIVDVHAREILDSRGNPTLECEVTVAGGAMGRAAVPSGASTGEHEAHELRDGEKTRYGGKGVRKAVENVRSKLAPRLVGMDAAEQEALDRLMIELDGTPTKKSLGANAILGVSLAAARAAASAHDIPLYRFIGGVNARTLPVPLMNILNGGARRLECRRPGVHGRALGRAHFRRGAPDGRGDLPCAEGRLEGPRPCHRCRRRGRLRAQPALEPRGARGHRRGGLEDHLQARLRRRARARRRRERADRQGEGHLRAGRGRADAVAPGARGLLRAVGRDFPIVSIEDGFAEDDWEGWKLLTDRLGERVQLVGDDLFVTNVERLARGLKDSVANAVLIKVNQIGTLTETLECVRMAHFNGYRTIMSHRSGETEDSFIADLAVACDCGMIKTGSASRSDRVAKYNQLLRIEEELGLSARYAGKDAFPRARK
jgi:enolase